MREGNKTRDNNNNNNNLVGKTLDRKRGIEGGQVNGGWMIQRISAFHSLGEGEVVQERERDHNLFTVCIILQEKKTISRLSGLNVE